MMRSAEWILPTTAYDNISRAFCKSSGSDAFSAITRSPGLNSSFVPPQNPLAINSSSFSVCRKFSTRSAHFVFPTPVCKMQSCSVGCSTFGVRRSMFPNNSAPSRFTPLSKRINALLSAGSAKVTAIISLPSGEQLLKLFHWDRQQKPHRLPLSLLEEERAHF